MPRIINFRPLFYCFLAFAVGIGFANYIFSSNFLIIAFVCISAIILFLLCYYKKCLKKLVCVFVAFVVGLGFFYMDFTIFSGTNYAGKDVQIYGRISSDIYKADTYSYVTLENVQIDGKNDSNISVCIYVSSENDSIKTGNYLLFDCQLYNYQIFENGLFNSYIYKDNTPYYAFVNIADLTVQAGNLTLVEQFKQYIKQIFFANMSSTTASLAYSIIFGDKTDLDQTVKSNFSVSGIAHLLAVSGLHIGFLVAILFWFFKKLKCEGIKRLIYIALILFVYCYFCQFSASIVRASIMCIAFLATKIFGKQYDLLNSVGIAGIIILLIWPLYVFDAGFLMSFVSVLSIALFFKSFSKFFVKIKIPHKVADAMAIDLCTTLAILPLLAIYFNQLSLFSLLANLICIPIFALGYMFLFLLTIFVGIFSFFGFLLMLPNIIFQTIILLANFFASIDWAIVSLVVFNIGGIVAFYLCLFLLSRFFLVKFWKKLVSICVIISVCGVLTLSFCSPITPQNFSYTQLNSQDACAIMTTQNGEVLMIGGTEDLDYVKSFLKYKRLGKIDTLIVTTNCGEDFGNFVKLFQVENIIFNLENLTQIGDFEIEFLTKNDITKAVYVKTGDFGVLFAINLIGSVQAQTLQTELQNYDIDLLYTKNLSQGYLGVFDYKMIASKYKISTTDLQNFATMISGSFTFGFENDTITNIRSVN
ncbi:MAG: ComEC/Rec2 family competence protein [Clostridia bacterium]|nr:ComEC/Rec2 family competence protein [Clostridia bacterium]